jgi:seryl-tRNA synthetase
MTNFFFLEENFLDGNQVKAFKERVSYLNSKIISCNYKNNRFKLTFSKKINFTEKKIIRNSCKKLISRIKIINPISNEKIIFENKSIVSEKKNIFEYLKKIKSIKNTSPGIFTLRGKFLDYFNKLDLFLLRRAELKRYEKIHVHNMLPLESFVNNNYILNFPHHIMFATHVKRDLKFIDRLSCSNNVSKINNAVAKPDLVISPTVCYHIFETLKNSFMKKSKVFDSFSSCSRFESINYSTFERLQSFSMREYVAFGSPEFIKKFLANNIDYFKKAFVKNKIKFKIVTANDAFFSQRGIKKMSYQSLNELKFEFQFWLPNEKKWLAVGSFNNHLDVLVNKYNIKNNKKTLHSGCIGWGYERLVYAIISQGKKISI